MDDYTASLRRGRHRLRGARRRRDRPALAAVRAARPAPSGSSRTRGAIVPAGRGTAADADARGRRHGADAARLARRCSRLRRPRRRRRRRSSTAAGRRPLPAASWSAPTRGPTRCWPASDVDVPLEVTLEQVDLLRARPTRQLRARPAAAVDLDGRPVVLRLPAATASRPSRRPRTAAARRSTRDDRGPPSPDPAMLRAARAVHGRLLPGVRASRCARCAASTR